MSPSELEIILDRLSRLQHKDNLTRWKKALLCKRAGVGENLKGITAHIANVLGLEAVTIRGYVRAIEAYKAIRYMCIESGAAGLADAALRELTVSHFSALYRLHEAYDLTDAEVLVFIDSLLKHKERIEPYSVRILEQEVADAHKDTGLQKQYTEDTAQEIMSAVIRWRSLAGLPEDFPRHALNTLMEWVEGRMK